MALAASSLLPAPSALAAAPDAPQWIVRSERETHVLPVAYDGPMRSVVKKQTERDAAPVMPRTIEAATAQAQPIQNQATAAPELNAAAEAATSETSGALQWRSVRRSAEAGEIHRTALQQDEAAPRDPFDEFGLPPALQGEPSPTAPSEGPGLPAEGEPGDPGLPFGEEPRTPEEEVAPPTASEGLQFGPPQAPQAGRPAAPQQGPSMGETPYYQGRPNRIAESELDDCRAAFEKLQAKTLPTISLDIGVGGTPGQDFPIECELTHPAFAGRHWHETDFLWKASALCHKPLYFEDVALERYGHTINPLLQPLVSGAHFFGSAALLPYKMGLKPPTECVYALGYYRPGNCAPKMISPLGFTPRAGLAQAGAIVGATAIIP